jgi:hypothetical protein
MKIKTKNNLTNLVDMVDESCGICERLRCVEKVQVWRFQTIGHTERK